MYRHNITQDTLYKQNNNKTPKSLLKISSVFYQNTLCMVVFRISFDDFVKNFHCLDIVHMGPKAFARIHGEATSVQGSPQVCTRFVSLKINKTILSKTKLVCLLDDA